LREQHAEYGSGASNGIHDESAFGGRTESIYKGDESRKINCRFAVREYIAGPTSGQSRGVQ